MPENTLHCLEEAYLILLARPFAFKFREQVRRPRKVYTVDNGLTRALSTKVIQDRGVDFLIRDGTGPAVRVEALWKWLLEA